MALEATASQAVTPVKAQDVLFDLGDSQGRIEVDLRPMVRMIVERRERDADVSTLAALFHETVAAAWEAAVMKAVGQTGLKCIVLSGGVFCNQLLSESLARRLQAGGLEVLRHMRVPPNDGGIALGQAAVAARRSSGASPVK